MKELFFSELRRFRTIGLILGGVHLLVFVLLNQLIHVPQMKYQAHVLLGGAYMMFSLGFALYQFGSYRSPGRWTWLMHRPLSPNRIFTSIAGATFMLVLAIVAVPLLLVLAGGDLFGGRVVDLRHYVAVAHIVLLCFASWLAGSYVILNHRRSAAVILILPILAFFRMGSSFEMFVPELLCIALLLYILRTVFKPNHAAPPSTAASVIATALPLLLSFYFVLAWGGSTLYQWGQIVAGTHPLNSDIVPAGGFTESARMYPRDRILAGLKATNTEVAKRLGEQLKSAPVTGYQPDVDQYAVRNQSSNADDLLWPDGSNRSAWSFSHDEMRFRGRDMLNGSDTGFFGAAGKGSAERFAEVPFEEAGYLLTPHTLYRPTGGAKPLEKTFVTEGREQIVMAPNDIAHGKDRDPPRYRYVLTNARLVALDLKTNALRFSVPLPGPYSDLAFVDVAELPGQTVVSLMFGGQMIKGAGTGNQYVMLAEPGAAVREVARRALTHDFALLFEHKDFWLSPVLHELSAVPGSLIYNGAIPDVIDVQVERSANVWTAALVAALLAAAAGAAWLARTNATPRRKLAWIASCLLIGLPALFALMVLQPRIRKAPATAAHALRAVAPRPANA